MKALTKMDVKGWGLVLKRGKVLVPDRFPVLSPDVAEAWAHALSEVDFPLELWLDAVNVWATERVGDRMCSPRDLKQAAFDARNRWEQEPDLARALGVHRAARLDANYVRMGLEPVRDSPAIASKSPPVFGKMFDLPPPD